MGKLHIPGRMQGLCPAQSKMMYPQADMQTAQALIRTQTAPLAPEGSEFQSPTRRNSKSIQPFFFCRTRPEVHPSKPFTSLTQADFIFKKIQRNKKWSCVNLMACHQNRNNSKRLRLYNSHNFVVKKKDRGLLAQLSATESTIEPKENPFDTGSQHCCQEECLGCNSMHVA